MSLRKTQNSAFTGISSEKDKIIVKNDANALANTEDYARLHQQFLAAATSPNTRRAYQTAIRQFLRAGFVLPATEQMLRDYLLTHAASLKSSTLSLRIAALSSWHTLQGFDDPTAKPDIRKLLTGIRRTHGTPTKKAAPVDSAMLSAVCEQLSKQGDLAAQRDMALLCLGFSGGFRRSELAALKAEDLQWEKRGVVILLPRSKTDQTGEGLQKAIPYTNEASCAATLLKRWLAAADITQGPVFRAINQWGQLSANAMTGHGINLVIKKHLQDVAGPSQAISSHSLRRGMATEAYHAGASFRAIKRQGGWRSDTTVHRYIADADLFEESVVTQIAKRKP
ncbi:site-specific integrase [Undibacterium squillarum]|uniref:site-specific integrase n=1 Tax=Undibacterium squillarum TaxID=1131567 RepID=UPI0035AF5AF0